jgi:hypothetical protein
MHNPMRIALVTVVMAVAGVMAVASPVHAQDRSSATMASVRTACDREVCETAPVRPAPRLLVEGRATPPSARCGHFELTVRTRSAVQRFPSPRACGIRPSYRYDIALPRPLPVGATLGMQFISNPPTPGAPILRLI